METTKENCSWQTVSEIELIYKSKVKASQRPQISSSQSAYELILQQWDANKIEFFEQFKILLLNHANKVLGIYEISSGGITGTIVDLRLIFSAALKANATSLIMVHNHPSGKTMPSDADKKTTKKVVEAGRLLDVSVLDHLIITPEKYYSFADEGGL